jgi:hypothetical protein
MSTQKFFLLAVLTAGKFEALLGRSHGLAETKPASPTRGKARGCRGGNAFPI